MESLLWALNLVAVCFLCRWALKEDSLPEDPDENAVPEPTPANRSKVGPGAATRREGRPPLPRK